MSRLSTLSAAAIKAMFSSETDEQLIILLTIQDPEQPTQPIRLTDGFTGRLTSQTTDNEVIYGVTSRGNQYTFLPLEISLPSEEDEGVGKCSVVLQYVTPEAIILVREHLTNPTNVTLELILASNPDYVEATFSGFQITGASYSAQQITLDLEMINYSREPFPCYNFTPNYFPGLF